MHRIGIDVDVVEGRDTKRPHPKLAARLQNAMREEGSWWEPKEGATTC